MNFNPMAFLENLKYMGLGMLGIFVVMDIQKKSRHVCSFLWSEDV